MHDDIILLLRPESHLRLKLGISRVATQPRSHLELKLELEIAT